MTTKTIGAAGDFLDIGSWSDYVKALIPTDFVEDEVGELIDDAVYAGRNEDDLNFAGVDTDGFLIILQGAAGVRHNGDFGNGARVEHAVAGNFSSVYEIRSMVLRDMSITQTSTSGSSKDGLTVLNSSLYRVISRSLNNEAGSRAFDINNSGTIFLEACRGLSTGSDAFRIAKASASLINCSALSGLIGFNATVPLTGDVGNCVVHGCTTGFVGDYSGANARNNASDDATHPGIDPVSLSGDPFDVDGYTPTEGGELDGVGLFLNIALDAANTAYRLPPSIGAYEVATPLTTPLLSNPTVDGISDVAAVGHVVTDGVDGTLFYVVSEDSGKPSIPQIQAGLDANGAPGVDSGPQAVTVSGVQDANFTGLTMSTTYYGSFQHQNAAVSESNVVRSNSFSTLANNVSPLPGVVPWDGGIITPESVLFYDQGRHDGADGVADLADSTKTWTPGQWIGFKLRNTSDDSFAIITGNTANTIQAPLTNGNNNIWSDGFYYEIVANIAVPDTLNYEITGASSGGIYSFQYGIHDDSESVNTVPVTISVDTNTPGPPIADGTGTIILDARGVPTFTLVEDDVMTVGAFELTNSGLEGHQDGSIDPAGAAFYAVLTTDAGGAPNLVTDIDYGDISAGETVDADYDQQVATLSVSEAVVGPPNTVMVDMALVDFGAAVTISARYFWVLQGSAAAPVAGDRILGFMDLNDAGAGDVSSVASDFKVDANNPNGLYRTTKA